MSAAIDMRVLVQTAAEQLANVQSATLTCDRTHMPVRYDLPRDVLLALAFAEAVLLAVAACMRDEPAAEESAP